MGTSNGLHSILSALGTTAMTALGRFGEPLKTGDGRQSAAAMAIARGTVRLLRDLGYECVSEVSLSGGRRADVLGISRKGDIWIVEIKSGPADFHADNKWHEYLGHCDYFSFAVDTAFPRELLPDDVGVIVADRFGASQISEPTSDRLSGARRKAVLIRYGRAAARRLAGMADPLGASDHV